MDKSAKELIEKMAGIPKALNRMPEAKVESLKGKQYEYATDRRGTHLRGHLAAAEPAGSKARTDLISTAKEIKGDHYAPLPDVKKTSSMKNIIDDLIKGAQHNTFGRPVSIQQGSSPTPLDLAKFAGQLQALSEQGYSVKQAAEYLGLTEHQVQDIVSTVR